MGALKLFFFGVCLTLLLFAGTQAGRNFQIFRQYILQLRQERAMKEASIHLSHIPQRPEPRAWHALVEGNITQPLDHFNRKDLRTFNQRFWINEKYWRRHNGPVFLYIGGESDLSKYDVLSGHHVEMAWKEKALVVALEHRFYGASINSDGLKDQNLLYLSSQQALSDLASFHQMITQKYNLTPNNPWICFGGSYPGSLAAWFRLKFPHLVFAAVASSAPVKAQLDFRGYNQVVAESLANPEVGGSNECREAVAEAFATVDRLIYAGGQAEKLAKDFRSCDPLKETADLIEMVNGLAGIFMVAVQYNEIFFPVGNVAGVCKIMANQTGSPYQRLMVLVKVYLDSMNDICINNCHKCYVEELCNTTVSVSSNMRQWTFQTCTEFGYYQTCEDPTCVFSSLMDLAANLDICRQVFNISQDSVQAAVDFTNEYYGADHPKASRVLFVNGDIDPWHALSVLKNQSRSELALVIKGTSHCEDMSSSLPFDPRPLVQARQRIEAMVAEWLALAQKMAEDS